MAKASPVRIILTTSIVTGIVVASVYYLLHKYLDMDWRIFGLSAVFVTVLCYGLYYYVWQTTINQRIQLVYKYIHNLKTGDDSKLDLSTDVIGNVNHEVSEWADEQKSQINELKQRAKYRREFLGNVSHELKTPIFTLEGYIHTLIDGGLEDPEVNREFLHKAARSLDRLSDIVSDLEIISKLESQEQEMDIKPIDIKQMTNEVIESLEMLSETSDVNLLVDESTSSPIMVSGDKGQIRQVMENLLNNSIKYGKENGETKISFHSVGDQVLIEVADNGIGIDEKHLPHLFERFYRVDKGRSRDEGGTGLGLAIVKHIVEAHGQSIQVRSEANKGTTFGFTLNKA